MKKKYIVTLMDEERQRLQEMLSRGKTAARNLMHARTLLKADASPGGPGWKDQAIAEALEVGRVTAEQVRKEFVKERLVLQRYKGSRKSKQLTDDPMEMAFLLGGHRYGCQYDYETQTGIDAFSAPV